MSLRQFLQVSGRVYRRLIGYQQLATGNKNVKLDCFILGAYSDRGWISVWGVRSRCGLFLVQFKTRTAWGSPGFPGTGASHPYSDPPGLLLKFATITVKRVLRNIGSHSHYRN